MGDTTNSNEPNMAEKKPEPPENMKVSLYGKLLARHYGIFFGRLSYLSNFPTSKS